jgi:hypothetical protein
MVTTASGLIVTAKELAKSPEAMPALSTKAARR